jgi:hypothetical protein
MPRPNQRAIMESKAALESGDANHALEIRKLVYGEEAGAGDVSSMRILELILTRTPALFANYPPTVLQPIRIAAALMELWGTNTIPDLVKNEDMPDQRFSPQAIGHMLHSHACFLKKIEEFRAVGIKRVEFIGSNDPTDCQACQEADGESYTTEGVPELPLVDCQCKSPYGCRLKVIAYVK